MKRAGSIAEAYSKNVVNVLTFGPSGAQEVLLEVKFAEVDRSAVSQSESICFRPVWERPLARPAPDNMADSEFRESRTLSACRPLPLRINDPHFRFADGSFSTTPAD